MAPRPPQRPCDCVPPCPQYDRPVTGRDLVTIVLGAILLAQAAIFAWVVVKIWCLGGPL